MSTFMNVCLLIFGVALLFFLYELITYKIAKRRVERNKKLAEQMRNEAQGIEEDQKLPENVIKLD